MAGKPPDILTRYLDMTGSADKEAGANAKGVVGVVDVVAVTIGVNIPKVSGVANIRRTQPVPHCFIVQLFNSASLSSEVRKCDITDIGFIRFA